MVGGGGGGTLPGGGGGGGAEAPPGGGGGGAGEAAKFAGGGGTGTPPESMAGTSGIPSTASLPFDVSKLIRNQVRNNGYHVGVVKIPGTMSGSSAITFFVEGAMGVKPDILARFQLMSATIGRSGKTDGRLNSGTSPSTGLYPYSTMPTYIYDQK